MTTNTARTYVTRGCFTCGATFSDEATRDEHLASPEHAANFNEWQAEATERWAMTTPLAANYPRGVTDIRIAEARKAWSDAQDALSAYLGYCAQMDRAINHETVRELSAAVEQAQAAYLAEVAR